MKYLRLIGLLLCYSLAGPLPAAAQEPGPLDVFGPNWFAHRDAPNALYRYFHQQTRPYLQRRDAAIAAIADLQQLQAKQADIREALTAAIGPFPEKTPLQAEVTRVVPKDGYRMEHILFQSRPNFYVTATLYLPTGTDQPAPAILYCSGHNVLGYRSPVYQHVLTNLVKKGFAVLAFDPFGQGERLQYYDPETGQSRVGSPTRQHSYPAPQLLLAGTNVTNYMIWDGIRAIDYLASRPEVDASRIGVTGRSGGGTQAAYLGAVDDRVAAVAVENYLTSFARLYESKGPQDAEQHLTHGIKRGIDHPDFLLARLPKPSLLIATTNDYFSIQGARETFQQVRALADLYPAGQRHLTMVEDDAGHASTPKNREAMYAFFQQHLHHPGDAGDLDVTIPTAAELQVTPTGQVATSTTSESLFSINRAHAATLQPAFTHPLGAPEVATIKTLAGYVAPPDSAANVFTGRVVREGYTIDKYYTTGSGGYPIPYLHFKPAQSNGKAVIYAHPQGKQAAAQPGGAVEQLVLAGYAVFCPDVIGLGEMGPGAYRGDAYINGVSYNLSFMGLQIGETVLGLRASDVVALRHTISRAFPVGAVYAVSAGELAAPLLHAALFDEGLRGLLTVGDFPTYATLAATEYYDSRYAFSVVPGALAYYDLPLLEQAVATRGYAHLTGDTASGAAIVERLQALSEPGDWTYEAAKATEQQQWAGVAQLRKRIREPRFRKRDFAVDGLTALAGTTTDARAAIQATIEACAEAGGGRVVIPKGTFFIDGPLHLRGNVNLHLSEGSELSFGTDADRYLPLVKVRWEGTVCYNYSPLIYGHGLENVAITGTGTINGNGREWSIAWRKQQKPAQLALRTMGQHGVPEAERVFGPGHFLRPTLIELYECENVWIEGVTIRDSPFWTVHPVFCTNVILRKLHIVSNSLNDDGIDPDSSEDVLIEYCTIDTHDDAISIKAGRDQDAWTRKGSKHILIQHNTLSSQSNALCIGSEMSGTVENVYMRDNTILRAHNAINLKCNLDRGGAIRDVFIRNTAVDTVQGDLFKVQMDYHSYRGGNFPTEIERIYISGLQAAYVGQHPYQIVGVPQAEVSRVLLDGLQIQTHGESQVLRYVNQVVLH